MSGGPANRISPGWPLRRRGATPYGNVAETRVDDIVIDQ